MSEDTKIVERKCLYDQVWSKPLSKLGPQYGISDVGLKKICKALNIPTPPRGYWAKRQNNIRVKKAQLPKPKRGQPTTYTIRKQDTDSQNCGDDNGKLSDEVLQIFAKLEIRKPIKVAKRLTSPHPLVATTKRVLSKAETDKYGTLLGDWREQFLDIKVAPASLSRALLIIDAIIKFFERFDVEIIINNQGRYRQTYAEVFNEKISFFLREPSRQVDHELTEKEKADQKRWSHSFAPKYDYHPTGRLVLEIEGYGYNGIKNKWSDKKYLKLEEQLQEFVTCVFKHADLDRTRRIERLEREHQWELERQRREEHAKEPLN